MKLPGNWPTPSPREVRRLMDARQCELFQTTRYLRASEGKRGDMAYTDWRKFADKLAAKYGRAVVDRAEAI